MTVSDDRNSLPRWLAIARELQAIAQNGLTYSLSGYDTARYTRLAEIAAMITADHSGLTHEEALANFRMMPGYATPKVDVRGAIVRDGRILLVRETNDGKWAMPGGWADVGETPAEVVSREIREETGLETVPVKLIGVFDGNRSGTPLQFHHAYKLVFLCTVTGGDMRPGDDTSAVDFFPFDQLPPFSHERTNDRHVREVRAHIDDPVHPAAFD